jgi:protoheme IX farnesyltransferase
MLPRVKAYYELGKPRLSALAVFAVVAGCYMGWSSRNVHPPLGVVLGTTIGTFMVAIGSSALNMFRERTFDARMERTRNRPLPSGRLRPGEAFAFGLGAAALGLGLLAASSLPVTVVREEPAGIATETAPNLLAAALCGLILLSYVLVYTPMKRITPLNTLVGAIPGALPPVVGFAAITGTVNMVALVLFAILFCWQIPHFLAIAWRWRDDYARGGFRMLPVVDPSGHRTTTTMLLYVAGLGIASLVPVVTQVQGSRMAGARYAAIAICLDLLFFVPAVWAALRRTEAAMRMTFHASLVYLPLLFAAMVWDRYPMS